MGGTHTPLSSQLNGRHTHTSLLSVEWEAHTHLSQSTAHSTPKATHTQSVAFTASTANYLYNTILMAWLCLLLEASPSILETHIYGWSPLAVHMPHLPPGRQLCHPGSGTIPAVDQSNSQWRQQSVEATQNVTSRMLVHIHTYFAQYVTIDTIRGIYTSIYDVTNHNLLHALIQLSG